MSRADEEERASLKRLAALLLSLAGHAERASLRSLPIRLLLFWILRPAEAYARNVVADALRDIGARTNMPEFYVEALAPIISGHDATRACDVLRLAVIFETLAALAEALCELVGTARHPWQSDGFDRLFRDAAPHWCGLAPARRNKWGRAPLGLVLSLALFAHARGPPARAADRTGVATAMRFSPHCGADAPTSLSGGNDNPCPALRPKNRSVARTPRVLR